jgi:hypothetical protein
MRGRCADVDANGPQTQPFGSNVPGQVIGVVILMTVMVAVVRMRGRR